MAMVLLVTMILSITSGTLFLTTLSQQSNSAGQVFQSLALNAAEAGLSRAYQAVETTSLSTVPCGTGALGEPLGTTPRSSSYSDSIAFYANNPPSGSALACSAVTSKATIPASALVKSVGTDANVQQGMEALVAISVAASGSVFDQALYVNGPWTASGGSIDGSVGNNANAYINGNVSSCSNGAVVEGNLTMTGGYSTSGNCHIYGNVDAQSIYLQSGSPTIGGNVTAYSSDILVNNSGGIIDGNAYAYTTITNRASPGILGTQVAEDKTLTAPPVDTFPTVTLNAATWQAAGWTVDAADNDCSNDSASIFNEINEMATATSPTVLQTNCTGGAALTWGKGNPTIKLAQNLAIFSTTGFSMPAMTWQSADGSPHYVYIIVPTGSSCASSGGGITLTSSATFSPPLQELFFTPCAFTGNNGVTGYGQIYAGSMTEAGGFSFTFYQPPPPAGATGGTMIAGAGAVTDGVVWEHQYQI